MEKDWEDGVLCTYPGEGKKKTKQEGADPQGKGVDVTLDKQPPYSCMKQHELNARPENRVKASCELGRRLFSSPGSVRKYAYYRRMGSLSPCSNIPQTLHCSTSNTLKDERLDSQDSCLETDRCVTRLGKKAPAKIFSP